MEEQSKLRLLEECRFIFSRSGGSGGQKINKTSSRVTLIWNVFLSQALSSQELERLKRRLSKRLNAEGELLVSADSTRSQSANRAEAEERFEALIEGALAQPKKRRKTRIPASQKESRVVKKRRRAERLRSRRPDW